MDEDASKGPRRKSELRRALHKLAQGYGVQRDNLLEAFNGELGRLRLCWGVNLRSSGEKTRVNDERVARNIVRANLRAHVAKLTPPKGKSKRQFTYAVLVNFNALTDEAGELLKNKDLTSRRNWLATKAAEAYRVEVRTSRRYFYTAIEQIERQILAADYEPVQTEARSSDDNPESSEAYDDASDFTDHPRDHKRGRPWVAGGAILTAAANIVTVLVIVNPFPSSTTATAAPPDPIIIQRSPIDLRTGQNTAPDFVVPESLSTLEKPPPFDGQNPAPFDAWKEAHHAVYADRMVVSFLARSGRVEPTVITGARAKVTRRDSPLSGTWIVPQGAGTQPVRQLYADLDASPPKITKDGGWEFPLRISQTDPEAFSFVTRTQNCHCYWVIELDVMLPDGKPQVVTVDDNGKPFELTSPTNTKDKLYLELK